MYKATAPREEAQSSVMGTASLPSCVERQDRQRPGSVKRASTTVDCTVPLSCHWTTVPAEELAHRKKSRSAANAKSSTSPLHSRGRVSAASSQPDAREGKTRSVPHARTAQMSPSEL